MFRWLQLLQARYGLYNVDNRHDCLLTRDALVQPFAGFPDFYGCLKCGKYHLCRREEATCPLGRDEARRTCLYSAHLMTRNDDFTADGCFDDWRLFADEARPSFLRGSLDAPGTMRVRRVTAPVQRDKTREQADLKAYASALGDADMLGVESLSSVDEDEEEEEFCPDAPDDEPLTLGFDAGEPELSEEEEAASVEPEADYEAMQDGVEGSILDADETETHIKNYHSNIHYWNAYYGFLSHYLRRAHSLSPEERFAAAVAREQPRTAPPPIATVVVLDRDARTLIDAEVLALLGPRLDGAPDTERTALLEQYARLCANIARLVYGAPLLREVAQRRGKPARAPQQVLPVQRLVRVLVCSLLCRSFVMQDQKQFRLELWSEDGWLEPQGERDAQAEGWVTDALRFYAFCPHWLRARVFECVI